MHTAEYIKNPSSALWGRPADSPIEEDPLLEILEIQQRAPVASPGPSALRRQGSPAAPDGVPLPDVEGPKAPSRQVYGFLSNWAEYVGISTSLINGVALIQALAEACMLDFDVPSTFKRALEKIKIQRAEAELNADRLELEQQRKEALYQVFKSVVTLMLTTAMAYTGGYWTNKATMQNPADMRKYLIWGSVLTSASQAAGRSFDAFFEFLDVCEKVSGDVWGVFGNKWKLGELRRTSKFYQQQQQWAQQETEAVTQLVTKSRENLWQVLQKMMDINSDQHQMWLKLYN